MPPYLRFYHQLLLRHQPSISQCSRILTRSPHTSSRTLALKRPAPPSQPRPPHPQRSNAPTAPPPPSPNGSNSPTSRRPRGQLLNDAFTFFAAIGFISFIWNNVFCIRAVSGDSMYPYLNGEYNTSMAKDRVGVDMWRPAERLRRGMVVAFYSPSDPNRMLVKRIVALEGDVVVTKPPYPIAKENVPFGNVWVEGEEGKSLDSNYFGPIPKGLIVGKVVGVIWPWRRRCWTRWQDWRGSPRVLVGKGKVEVVEFY